FWPLGRPALSPLPSAEHRRQMPVAAFGLFCFRSWCAGALLILWLHQWNKESALRAGNWNFGAPFFLAVSGYLVLVLLAVSCCLALGFGSCNFSVGCVLSLGSAEAIGHRCFSEVFSGSLGG
ncbi:hypothetical protein Ancab_032029, partial [Ancistrocladus abbreviatus]